MEQDRRPHSSIFPIPDPSTLPITQIPHNPNPLTDASISSLFNAVSVSETVGDVFENIESRTTPLAITLDGNIATTTPSPKSSHPSDQSNEINISPSGHHNMNSFLNLLSASFESPHPIAQSLKAPLFKRYGGMVDFFLMYKMGSDPHWSHTLKNQGKDWSYSHTYGSRNLNELNLTTTANNVTLNTQISNQPTQTSQQRSDDYKIQSRTSIKYKLKKAGEGSVEVVSQGASSKIVTAMKVNVNPNLTYSISSSLPLPYAYDIAKDEYLDAREKWQDQQAVLQSPVGLSTGKSNKSTPSQKQRSPSPPQQQPTSSQTPQQYPPKPRPPTPFTPSITSSFTYRPVKPVGSTNCAVHFEATQKDYQVLSASYSHSIPFNYLTPPSQQQQQPQPQRNGDKPPQPPPIGELSFGMKGDLHLIPTFDHNNPQKFSACQFGVNYEVPQLLTSYVLFEPAISSFNTGSSSGSFNSLPKAITQNINNSNSNAPPSPISPDLTNSSGSDNGSDGGSSILSRSFNNTTWFHQIVWGLHHQRSKNLSWGAKVVVTPEKGAIINTMAEYKPTPDLSLKLKLVTPSFKSAFMAMGSGQQQPQQQQQQPFPSQSPSISPFALGGITAQLQYQFPRQSGYSITAHGHYNPLIGTTNFGMQATLALDKTNFAAKLFEINPSLTPLSPWNCDNVKSSRGTIRVAGGGDNERGIEFKNNNVDATTTSSAKTTRSTPKPTGKSVSMYSQAVHANEKGVESTLLPPTLPPPKPTSEKPSSPILPSEDLMEQFVDPQTGFFKKGFKFYNYDIGSQARVSNRGD